MKSSPKRKENSFSARLPGRLFAFVLLLSTVGCDRVTKHLAATSYQNLPAQSYLSDTIRLEYAENSGAFLSLGSSLPPWLRTGLLKIGVGIALAAIAFVALKHHWEGWRLIGASLTLAGGLSNLVDRIARDSVVDFISVGIGSLRTGIFNLADVAIMVGGALIVIGISGTDHSIPKF